MVYQTFISPRLFPKLLLIGYLAISPVSASFADEISDAISEAQKSYQAGDLVSTKQALDTASQLLSQKTRRGLQRLYQNLWQDGRQKMLIQAQSD
ncbi:MAG: hypothetical protein ACKOBC_02320 [Hyphomicrobiales bacterium]